MILHNMSINNLVFEGGGVKGVAYGGALHELDSYVNLSYINNFAGASAGAITALLCAMGLRGDELLDATVSLDFKGFERNSSGVLRDMFRFFRNYGWNTSSYITEWFGNIMRSRFDVSDMTFSELHSSTGKGLYIVVTNITKGRSEVMSHETTPNTSVIQAVRASMSIPLFFTAFKFPGDDDYYADGGILNNFPIHIFDKERFLPNSPLMGSYSIALHDSMVYNPYTLAFRVDSTSEIENVITRNKTGNLIEYIVSIMGTVYETLQSSHLRQADWERTISIRACGVGTTEFDLSESKLNNLLESGRESVRDFFKSK